MEDTDARVHLGGPLVPEEHGVDLDAADERVAHPVHVAVHARRPALLPEADIHPLPLAP